MQTLQNGEHEFPLLNDHKTENNNQNAIFLIEDEQKQNGRWYHAGFHLTCILCGVGVLSLPWAFSKIGLIMGIILFFLIGILSAYSCSLLALMHEISGQRFDRYVDLGTHFFGKKIAYSTIVPMQFFMFAGIQVIYTVVGGQVLLSTIQYFSNETRTFNLIYCQIIFGVIEIFISQAPNLHSISILSITGSIISMTYSTIAIIASILHGFPENNLNLNYPEENLNLNFMEQLSGISSTIGIFFTSFSGQNVILEIQGTLRKKNGTTVPAMLSAITFAYCACAALYVTVGLIGYAAYGTNVPDNVILAVQQPSWMKIVANVGIFIHVTAAYQICSQLVFYSLELRIGQQFFQGRKNCFLKSIIRIFYVVCTTIVAIVFPFFGHLLGFVGAVSIGLNGFVIPNVLWIQNGPMTKQKWLVNVPLIFIGVAASLICMVGSVRSIFEKLIEKHS